MRDQKRLSRCTRIANRFGWAVQYSVFVCDLSPGEVDMLLHALGEVLAKREDRLILLELGEAGSLRRRRQLFWLGERPAALLDEKPPQVV
ncbi:CRISPR-associated endonuclease Cas2 [Aciditerrimonas ferrireducens]|nr:CRISPR-associated endonuclease Cas2 [Aciditerrimonas ferrireducens]